MLAKLNKITPWQAAFIIAVLGFAVFFTGLTNPFMGDDSLQVVNNPPVHSITHIKLFFEGGTFYNGQGLTPLSGSYYRPLMTTTFSLLYTVFGLHSFYFHLLQVLLCIGSAVILYLFFRYSFKPFLALVLSLVFLLHPINSQVAFSIPNMQDALYFFFGILALWLLFRYKSIRSLVAVAVCLSLSLLSKETGMLFVIMALLYLFWFNRKRLYVFIAIMIVPIALYLLLKVHAVGLLGANPNNGPIDSLNLGGRLLTAPSIMLLYIVRFLFPIKLASAYYWTYPTFSVSHTLLPLIADLAVVAIFVYLGILVRRKAPKAKFLSYAFFATWSALGVLLLLQITPLDMTAGEWWFYFPMVGVLGMIGIAISVLAPTLSKRLDSRVIVAGVAVLLVLLGLRTAFRGTDYRNSYILAQHDLTASVRDYAAYYDIASYDFSHGDYDDASNYARQSVEIYPTATNNYVLGQSLYLLGYYPNAYTAYINGISYKPYHPLYDGLAVLAPYYGNPSTNEQILIQGTKLFPQDIDMWYYLAIIEYRNGNIFAAKEGISQAHFLDKSDSGISTFYKIIMNSKT